MNKTTTNQIPMAPKWKAEMLGSLALSEDSEFVLTGYPCVLKARSSSMHHSPSGPPSFGLVLREVLMASTGIIPEGKHISPGYTAIAMMLCIESKSHPALAEAVDMTGPDGLRINSAINYINQLARGRSLDEKLERMMGRFLLANAGLCRGNEEKIFGGAKNPLLSVDDLCSFLCTAPNIKVSGQAESETASVFLIQEFIGMGTRTGLAFAVSLVLAQGYKLNARRLVEVTNVVASNIPRSEFAHDTVKTVEGICEELGMAA